MNERVAETLELLEKAAAWDGASQKLTLRTIDVIEWMDAEVEKWKSLAHLLALCIMQMDMDMLNESTVNTLNQWLDASQDNEMSQ